MRYSFGRIPLEKVQCAVCGKVTAGRLPRIGKHKGDGTFFYPRRHKVNGKDCPGNIQEGIMIDPAHDGPHH